jgi:predicted SAM-dependent methyltransferase
MLHKILPISILESKIFRQLVTFNYRIPRVAFGEKNTYGYGINWITVDIANCDFLVYPGRIPLTDLPSNSFKVIYSSHMLEHLTSEQQISYFDECLRLLKPGGVVRTECPSADLIINEYKANNISFFEKLKSPKLPLKYHQTHIIFLGLLSCYIKENMHIPVLASKSEIDYKLSSLSQEDFFTWTTSLQSPEQLKTAGHINPVTIQGINKLITNAGLIVTKSSSVFDYNTSKYFRNIQRKHRHFYSLTIDASKSMQ